MARPNIRVPSHSFLPFVIFLFLLWLLSVVVSNISIYILIRHQALDITSLDTVKSKRRQHWLVVESVQINRFITFSSVLIFVPRRDTKSITLLPLDTLAVDDTVPLSSHDMIHRGRGLPYGRGSTSCVQTLG